MAQHPYQITRISSPTTEQTNNAKALQESLQGAENFKQYFTLGVTVQPMQLSKQGFIGKVGAFFSRQPTQQQGYFISIAAPLLGAGGSQGAVILQQVDKMKESLQTLLNNNNTAIQVQYCENQDKKAGRMGIVLTQQQAQDIQQNLQPPADIKPR